MIDSLDHQAEESTVPFPHSPPPPPPNTAVTSPEAGPTIPRSGLDNETYFSVLKNLTHKDDDDYDDSGNQSKHNASSVHSAYAHSSESQDTGASTDKNHDQPEGVTLPPPYLPGSVPSTSPTPFSSPVKSSEADRSIFPSPEKTSSFEKQTTYQLQRSEEGARLAELVREVGNTSEDVKKPVMMPCEDEDGEVEVVMSGALDPKNAEECAFGELCAARVLFGMAKKDGDGKGEEQGEEQGEGEAKEEGDNV